MKDNKDLKAIIFIGICIVFWFGLLWVIIWGFNKDTENKGVLSVEKEEKERVKKPFKPVFKVKNNKDKWAGDGFASVLRNECNKCKKVCWHTAGDPGGMTCLGFATRDNSDLFIEILNHAWQMCQSQPIYNPIPSNAPFGIYKNFCYRMRTAYWDRYISKYRDCYYPAMMHLSDTAILQGHRATAKILQRSAGLKVDGIFGPKSKTFCQKGLWDKEGYVDERLKYLRSLKTWDRFGAGWAKRVKKMAEKY